MKLLLISEGIEVKSCFDKKAVFLGPVQICVRLGDEHVQVSK